MKRLLLAALLAASPAVAQDAENGEQIFAVVCATCHGGTAGGAGPMAEILSIAPPSLTGLAAQNGGVFPMDWVASKVDGRDPFLGHTGTMPLFGPYFEGDDVAIKTETGQPMITSRPIADLLAWLESVQE